MENAPMKLSDDFIRRLEKALPDTPKTRKRLRDTARAMEFYGRLKKQNIIELFGVMEVIAILATSILHSSIDYDSKPVGMALQVEIARKNIAFCNFHPAYLQEWFMELVKPNTVTV